MPAADEGRRRLRPAAAARETETETDQRRWRRVTAQPVNTDEHSMLECNITFSRMKKFSIL